MQDSNKSAEVLDRGMTALQNAYDSFRDWRNRNWVDEAALVTVPAAYMMRRTFYVTWYRNYPELVIPWEKVVVVALVCLLLRLTWRVGLALCREGRARVRTEVQPWAIGLLVAAMMLPEKMFSLPITCAAAAATYLARRYSGKLNAVRGIRRQAVTA